MALVIAAAGLSSGVIFSTPTLMITHLSVYIHVHVEPTFIAVLVGDW